MSIYIGNKYGFIVTEMPIGPLGAYTSLDLAFAWVNASAVSVASSVTIQYRPIAGGSFTDNSSSSVTSPRTWNVPYGLYEYQATVYFGGSPDIVTFTLQTVDQNNFLYIPELNPLIFWEKNKTKLPKYFTKHFEDYPFSERGYYWQDKETFCQPWQTTDIIFLQLESSFSPLVLQLKNKYGDVVSQLSASSILPHKYLTNVYSYEFAMSLANNVTDCYTVDLVAGFGAYQKVYATWNLFISSEILENTILLEYFDSKKVYKDVMFITGIKFQLRLPGSFGFLDKPRKDEIYKDQKYNSTLLTSKSSKQWPLSFGDQFGLPDDMINLIDEIFSCDNVSADNKLICFADGGKLEYVTMPRSRKRGVKLIVEDGLNRNSRVHQTVKDPTKRLIATVMVSPKVWGVQSGSNVIPVTNIE